MSQNYDEWMFEMIILQAFRESIESEGAATPINDNQ